MRQGGWLELLRGGNAARSAVVGGGMIIHAISTFIVVTILPSVVREIGGLQFFAWSTTLYVLACLLGGAVSARLLARAGARGSYRVALPVFALGTLVCAVAPSMPVLLAGRAIQGLGAGTLSALSFSMVRTLFDEALWSRALSLTSAAWGVATLAGPAVGGVFAEYHAWRAAFWSVFALVPFLLLLVLETIAAALTCHARPRQRHVPGLVEPVCAGAAPHWRCPSAAARPRQRPTRQGWRRRWRGWDCSCGWRQAAGACCRTAPATP